MQPPPPPQLGSARVICYTAVDERHILTGACRHVINGQTVAPVKGLAICQYPGDSGLYLFGCNSTWTVVTDTYHDTLTDAFAQAEFEYRGVSATWQYLQPADELLVAQHMAHYLF